jgi:hypothetical protein
LRNRLHKYQLMRKCINQLFCHPSTAEILINVDISEHREELNLDVIRTLFKLPVKLKPVAT